MTVVLSRPLNPGPWPFETQVDQDGVPTCLQRQEVVLHGKNVPLVLPWWGGHPTELRAECGWDVAVSPRYLYGGEEGVARWAG